GASELPGRRYHAAFGDGVRAKPGAVRLHEAERPGRARVDEAAVLLPDHVWPRLAHGIQLSLEMDGHVRLVRRSGLVLDRVGCVDAGVVHDYVDPSPGVDGLRHHRGRAVTVGDT